MTTFTPPINQAESLYVGYFGRAGDPSGTNYWIGQLNAGTITLAQMAASFATQPEATSKYPYLANPNISDPGTFVDQVYQNLFNHTADAAGKAYQRHRLDHQDHRVGGGCDLVVRRGDRGPLHQSCDHRCQR